MIVNPRIDNEIFIVELDGEFDLYAAPVFREEVGRFDLDSVRGIVLDFENVVYIDSSALGTVVGIRKRLMDKPFFIVGCNSSVRKIMTLTHLDELIPMMETIDAAVEKIIREEGAEKK